MTLRNSRVIRRPPDLRPDVRTRLYEARARLESVEARPRLIAARWATVLLAFGVFAIVYCTLFPFNFTLPHGMSLRQAAKAWDWRPYDPSDPKDWFDNVVLFLPLGFALGAMIRRTRLREWWILPIATTISLASSTCIECLQLWLPSRDSSLADIVANGTGGLLGAAAFLGWGTATLGLAEFALGAARRYLTFWRWVILFAAACAIVMYGPAHTFHDGHNLSPWVPYPIALGNVPTKDRPWTGTVHKFELASKALPAKDVASVVNGTKLGTMLPGAATTSYQPSGPDSVPDLSGRSPALQWRNHDGPTSGPADGSLSGEHWLETPTAAAGVLEAIAGSSEFTFHLSFTAETSRQDDLARIATISPDTGVCNLTIAQEYNDVVIRLRTILSGDNGSNPAWVIRGLLTQDSLSHDLVLVYKDPMLRVFVDGVQQGSAVESPPEFFGLGVVMARPPMLPLGGFGLEAYRVLFYLFSFTPLGYLLAVMYADTRTPLLLRRITAVLGLILPCIVMETVFVLIGNREVRVDHLLLALLLPVAAMAVSYWLFFRPRGSGQAVLSGSVLPA